jgi:hypothetical protein
VEVILKSLNDNAPKTRSLEADMNPNPQLVAGGLGQENFNAKNQAFPMRG